MLKNVCEKFANNVTSRIRKKCVAIHAKHPDSAITEKNSYQQLNSSHHCTFIHPLENAPVHF